MMRQNLHFFPSRDREILMEELRALLPQGGRIHATNGTYAYDQQMIVPTMLSGFKFVEDWFAKEDDMIVLAINSDASMRPIYEKTGVAELDRESQYIRGLKVAEPLADLLPFAKIAVVFYNEDTPHELYTAMSEAGLPLRTLHKWGYGTNPDDPSKIVGAELFDKTLAFPLPNDTKPVCYDLTEREDQSGILELYDLRQEFGTHGAPYLSAQNKVLFPVPPALASYAATQDSRSFHP